MIIMKKRSHSIIYNEKYGYLVMLKYKFNKGLYHQLLSGGVEKNETYDDAIRREIKEEINIEIDYDRIKKIYSSLNRSYYYLILKEDEIKNIKLSNEHIGYTFIKKQDFLPIIIKKQSKGEISEIVQEIIDKKII
jgi:hypothetical protein